MSVDTTDTPNTENESVPQSEPNDNVSVEQPETDEQQSGAEAAEEFNLAEFEASFGLAEGALLERGAKDEDSAYDALRAYVNSTLTLGSQPPQQKPETKAKAEKTENTSPAEDKDSEITKLRAELTDIKSYMQAQQQQATSGMIQELNNRIYKEVDSWSSPKYGTSKSRNYKQSKALNELIDMVQPHAMGVQLSGKAPPTVEKALRAIRPFHDEDFKPPTRNNAGAVLGTPGAAKKPPATDGLPRSIHEALQGRM